MNVGRWWQGLQDAFKRNNVQTILLDFDGTCVAHQYPRVGHDIGAQQVLRDVVANGHQLILFTMRSPMNYLDDALAWFAQNGIVLYGIQTHPEQSAWTASPKAYGNIIIDDTMLGAKLIDGLYLDWQWVAQILCQRGVITQTQLGAYSFEC
ncbi:MULTISPECIES: hypothetical protein [Vitreoscilla]|uniref:hypothetical protein n=1 Tax=Vitreoscilla TaxID=59 RepID=UPI0003A4787C|nr:MULTISPECIES: hypothetical protein [Vitreoscilla]